MKFGGTSVEDAHAFERAARIVRAQENGRPVVVVSAMSRVTDALIRSVELAAGGDEHAAVSSLEMHFERHRVVARSLPGEDVAVFDATLDRAYSGLRVLLGRASANPASLPSLEDSVVSYGERLCAPLLTAVLRAHGLPARHIDARRCIVTDDAHGSANPLADETARSTRAELAPLLKAGEIPVLGGFIAVSRSGATTTLGRGGSDYSAALVGAALSAREVQIWTDVTGVLTADPRLISDARTIPHLSYREAAELAYFGAKVLHPKTMQPAGERGIPIRVCNSRRPEETGTLICSGAGIAPPAVKAIAHKTGLTTVQVTSAQPLGANGFWSTASEVFDRHRAVLALLTTSETSVSMLMEGAGAPEAVLHDLSRLGTVEVKEERAIICVVGEGLRSAPGIAALAFNTISDVNIPLASLRASSVSLTFLVDEHLAAQALMRLHETFFGESELPARREEVVGCESFQPAFLQA